VRLLRFDRYVENMILTAPPHASLVPYTNYFHLGMLACPAVGSALFIGAGGGVGPRTFQAHAAEMRIDVVDIDPAVLEAARTLFFLEPSPAMRLVAADGRRFLRQSGEPYDCIVLDAFTIGGRLPFHLCTREFLDVCRGRMTDDGVFIMNINSAVEGRAAGIYRSIGATLSRVFPRVHVFVPGHSRDPAGPASRNVILLATASDRDISPEDWARAAEDYESASYVDGPVVREMVRDLVTPAPPFAATALTDDYCPIETMAF
jgi:spermidine synthase